MKTKYVYVKMFIFYTVGTNCPPTSTEMITMFKSKAGKCLILSTNRTTWFEAIQFCRRLDADLATVNTMDTLKAVVTSARSHGQFWIGLHRITWIDHSNSKNNTGRFHQ